MHCEVMLLEVEVPQGTYMVVLLVRGHALGLMLLDMLKADVLLGCRDQGLSHTCCRAGS